MRITRQTLLKIARDTVDRRKRTEWNLLAVYLHGSLLGPEPVLGGTADIDLVFVHNGEPPRGREIEALTDEVHLDILHHDRDVYRQGRELRLHPWLGPTIYDCKILYDPQHFLDFLQAGVRGLYHHPENTLARAQQLAESARQTWFEFYRQEPEPGPQVVADYLGAVANAVNAIACLSGPPLPERRFLTLFPARARAVDRPGLYLGALGLLGATELSADDLRAWLPTWQAALEALDGLDACPPALLPQRHLYYRQGMEALLASERPQDALWPLIHTWTAAACHLPGEAAPRDAWREVCQSLGLMGAEFGTRVAALDVYLDTIEEALELWGKQQGVV